MSEKMICPLCAIAYGYHTEGCPALMGNSAAIATPPASQESAIAPGMYQDTEGKVPSRIGDPVALYVQADPFARRESAGEAVPMVARYAYDSLHAEATAFYEKNVTLTAELAATKNELLREQEERKRAWEAIECLNAELAEARASHDAYVVAMSRQYSEATQAIVDLRADLNLWFGRHNEACSELDKTTASLATMQVVRDSLRDECERLREALTPKPPREGIYPWAVALEPTARNAQFWIEGARKEERKGHAILCAEQAVNAWKNAAYYYAEKLAALSAYGREVNDAPSE